MCSHMTILVKLRVLRAEKKVSSSVTFNIIDTMHFADIFTVKRGYFVQVFELFQL